MKLERDKNLYQDRNKTWKRELKYAKSPQVWIAEAINLRYSCEALEQYECHVYRSVFNDHIQPSLPMFFSSRSQRMLMGFSLENLIKGILMQDEDRFKEATKSKRLSWGKKGHDLVELYKTANITLTAQQNNYLLLWQTCAIWAGRYPLPLNANGLPEERKPVERPKTLLKRAKKAICEKLSGKRGNFEAMSDMRDRLQTSIGVAERQEFVAVFEDTKKILEQV